jgi:urease accessory protein
MTTDAALYRLQTWLSPAFPVGAFSYSHGIEYAVEAGLVGDRGSLVDWAGTVVCHGAGRIDGVLFVALHRAVLAGDPDAFAWALARANVMRGTSELALESRAQGAAFLETVAAAWPAPGLARWQAEIDRAARPPAYAVAVALAAALHGIAPGPALGAYLQALGANLVSAGQRLIPLGQSEAARAVAALEPVVAAAVAAALAAPPEDLGSAAPMVDLASMNHETQYTRLFRS